MYLWVGLGNPGRKYSGTRHNIGADILKKACYSGAQLACFYPKGFMNEAGKSVAKIVRREGRRADELVVVHDELDLPLGIARLSFGASSAGHKGVESIIKSLGTKEFWRLRVGIGDSGVENSVKITAERFVLKRFSKTERPEVKRIIDLVSSLVIEWDTQKLKPETIKFR